MSDVPRLIGDSITPAQFREQLRRLLVAEAKLASADKALAQLGVSLEYDVLIQENALPTEAPSSLSDLAAADLRRDVLWREAVRAFYLRGFERGIEEAARQVRAIEAEVEDGESVVNLCDELERRIRALSGNAAPQATPISLSDPAPPSPPEIASELNQGESGVEDLAQLIVELVDAAKVDDALDRVRRALAAAWERGVTAGRERASSDAPSKAVPVADLPGETK